MNKELIEKLRAIQQRDGQAEKEKREKFEADKKKLEELLAPIRASLEDLGELRLKRAVTSGLRLKDTLVLTDVMDLLGLPEVSLQDSSRVLFTLCVSREKLFVRDNHGSSVPKEKFEDFLLEHIAKYYELPE